MRPHHNPVHPQRWHRWWLMLTACVLLASGLAWLLLHYTLGAGVGELPHPAEAWLTRLHGAGAFAALFAAGLLAGHHMPAGHRFSRTRRHHRAQGRTGWWMAGLLAACALSSYGLLYLVPEDWRPATVWAHALAGLSLAALGGWHGRARARRRAAAHQD